MTRRINHSLLDDLYIRWAMWLKQRSERRRALRQYRLELRASRRFR